MSNDLNEVRCNLRAGGYFVAQTRVVCPRCLQTTRLVALGLPPGHEVLELDDAPDDGTAEDTWVAADHPAFLFHIVHLSENVRLRVGGITPAYRADAATDGEESGWTNHCEHCGSPFDDQDLFCEPGGAFFPVSDADARLIRLLSVDEAIDADASGYAPEPAFFNSMTRS
jgi:hypothetical protein